MRLGEKGSSRAKHKVGFEIMSIVRECSGVECFARVVAAARPTLFSVEIKDCQP